MAVPCRRCMQPVAPTGFGPPGGFLQLEAAVLRPSIARVVARNGFSRLFGLALAGLAAWAPWNKLRDRAASEGPACELERSART